MTKGELKKALNSNDLPDNTEVLLSVGKLFNEDGDVVWATIDIVDDDEKYGEPLLIGAGKIVTE